MNSITDHLLLPAWSDPVHDAQATFRTILQALAEPGLIQALPVALAGPAPLSPAMTAACLTLADFETAVWLDDTARTAAVQAYLRFHCGCGLVDLPGSAQFALVADALALPAFENFATGSMDYPDRSATLLIEVPTLTEGPLLMLRGPGIREHRRLHVGGLPTDFSARWAANQAGFPLGVDIVFCCGNMIAGLPRTTQIDH